MPSPIHAITGGTGSLGSHVAEQLVQQGHHVRVLARAGSDRRFLTEIGVETVEGDLGDPAAIGALVSDASHVYHCAAKTGNWGRWSEYWQHNVNATDTIVRACESEPSFQRLVFISSIAVYGHPSPSSGETIDEQSRLNQRPWMWDYYSRSKMEAENLVRRLDSRATILRPTNLYGIRDRAFLPRLLRTIQHRGMWLFGSGDNLQNILNVRDAATMAVLAAVAPQAAGQTYNCCIPGEITQRELVALLCDVLQLPMVRRRLPLAVAHQVAFLFELLGRARRQAHPPPLTRHALSVFVRPNCFSSEKAALELGWRPCGQTREGILEAIEWLRVNDPGLFSSR